MLKLRYVKTIELRNLKNHPYNKVYCFCDESGWHGVCVDTNQFSEEDTKEEALAILAVYVDEHTNWVSELKKNGDRAYSKGVRLELMVYYIIAELKDYFKFHYG